jgi:hypothetical protein
MAAPRKYVYSDIVKFLLDNPQVTLDEAAAHFGGKREALKIIARKEGVMKGWFKPEK